MRVMRTMNGEIEYTEIDPANLKQFKRRGWLEAPKPEFIPDIPAQLEEVQPTQEPEKVKNKGGRPKKVKS